MSYMHAHENSTVRSIKLLWYTFIKYTYVIEKIKIVCYHLASALVPPLSRSLDAKSLTVYK